MNGGGSSATDLLYVLFPEFHYIALTISQSVNNIDSPLQSELQKAQMRALNFYCCERLLIWSVHQVQIFPFARALNGQLQIVTKVA